MENKDTFLPKVRANIKLKMQAYRIAQERDISYGELVRQLLEKEIAKG